MFTSQKEQAVLLFLLAIFVVMDQLHSSSSSSSWPSSYSSSSSSSSSLFDGSRSSISLQLGIPTPTIPGGGGVRGNIMLQHVQDLNSGDESVQRWLSRVSREIDQAQGPSLVQPPQASFPQQLRAEQRSKAQDQPHPHELGQRAAQGQVTGLVSSWLTVASSMETAQRTAIPLSPVPRTSVTASSVATPGTQSSLAHIAASILSPHPSNRTTLGTAAASGGTENGDGLNLGHNSSGLIRMEFQGRRGCFLSSGRDLVTPPDQQCWLWARHTTNPASPMVVFEVHPLDSSKDNSGPVVALKSLASGKFLRAVGPGVPGPTWVLFADAPGASKSSAHFRVENDFLYSLGAKGYVGLPVPGSSDVRCHGPPAQNMQKKGSPRGPWAKLIIHPLSPQESHAARRFKVASSNMLQRQRDHVRAVTPVEVTKGTVAIGTAITSKGTFMRDVVDSPFFAILLSSFLTTFEGAKGQPTNFRYRFYVGFDKGDRLYDNPGAMARFKEAFARKTGQDPRLSLRLLSFRNTAGAPSWAVAQVMQEAYKDGFEWLFQLNDDARLLTKGWERGLASTLASNPIAPFVGATGPLDETNKRIFTQAFVHRTHMQIHGRFFPQAFKNYFSDDWISSVYGTASTFKVSHIRVKHETKAQKTGGIERYSPHFPAREMLGPEVEAGALRAAKHIGIDRVPLDAVCGYAPLVESIFLPLPNNRG